MSQDKYSAVWLSHSSIRDYLNCPRAYFLRNIYKDPITGHKITRMQPSLALGQIVHDVIEGLSVLPTDKRLSEPLTDKFLRSWEKITGEKGGFKNKEEEEEYKQRGLSMLARVQNNPGPILNKAIKIKGDLPNYWLSEEENIILCGKIDWLEYLENDDAVHIIDFKTGKFDENEDSLQLPIYLLLVLNCQTKAPKKASYWYLDREDSHKEVMLPEIPEATTRVLDIAKRIKLARQIQHFVCPQKDGCKYCIPLEQIKNGKGKLVAESEYHQDIYII